MNRILAIFLLLTPACGRASDDLAFASGSWFNLDRNGEGFVVQILADNRAVVTWFTYPPAGEPGEQAWMLGVGKVDGNRIEIPEMERPVGAVFGPGFDPGAVNRLAWGNLNMTFHNCSTATVTWDGMEGFGAGSMDLMRLSSIDDLACDPGVEAEIDRVISGRSGAFFDTSHSGEGWMMEILHDGRVVVYWFTYDDAGNQAWMIGVGESEGQTLWVSDMLISRGAHFGDSFNAADVVLEHWGTLGFHYETCEGGTILYESVNEAFGEGVLKPARLASLAATDCTQPAPVAPLNAGQWHWSAEDDMQEPASESSSVGLGAVVYLFGGFGGPQRLRRYDPEMRTFTDLADAPAGRHHPMLATDGNYLYVAGGYAKLLNFDNAETNFWRYDIEQDSWTELPGLPQQRAAGIALHAHGRIYIVAGAGIGNEIMSWNIGREEWELFDGSLSSHNDHTNGVFFENEIWQIAGRGGGETNTVKIWNPVTRAWRDGPFLKHPRAGFAAAVVQGQIMVTGGELIESGQPGIVGSLEIYAPGAGDWVLGPAIPRPVHGTSGASTGGEFVLIGGSPIAGSTASDGPVQTYIPAAAAEAYAD